MAPRRRGGGRGGRGRHMPNRQAQALQALDHAQPPEDFHSLHVFPTQEELHAILPPFLRRNLPSGSYSSTDHYLDVQYRLLREDFLRPLREGIADYRINLGVKDELEKNNKKKEIKVYKDVVFRNVNLTKGDLSILIVFNPREVPNPDNAFKTGSLLCFSMDNFEEIILATVVESYPEGVARGNIRVKLHDLQDILEIPFGDKYTMVEPNGFFDPYNHVLSALQSMALDKYPMRDFVVGRRRIVQEPSYLSSTRAVYDIKDYRVALFDDVTWPSPGELGLNPIQLRAFKMALCSELALIQGPPGTGKTYLGVQVVRTLVENFEATGQEAAPILVVCATNHALDQFLEHLTTVTSDLVRCGSQSQSHVLEPFLLSKRRRQYRKSNRHVEKMAAESEKVMKVLTRKVRNLLEDIGKIAKHRGIVSLQSLSKIIGSPDLARFHDGLLVEDEFLAWLEDQKVDKLSNANLANNESRDTSCISYVFDLDHINKVLKNNARQVEVLAEKVVKKKHGGNSAAHAADLIEKLNSESEKLIKRRDKITENLELDSPEISKRTAANYTTDNAWQLPTAKRWQLYHHWTSIARLQMEEDILDMTDTFTVESSKYKACKMEQDLEILKDAKVVGMTTSCSARLRPLLDNLKPRIMVVEEAGEVLEGHIVASLTRHCQHVILIGDHQQLRPITSSYDLTYKYNLDVSLFERLLNNRLPCVTLQVQHRMRPEIARLIVPAIYPQLTNHHSVTKHEDVMGVEKNVFFITHDVPDEAAPGMSRKNVHEAELLVALCRYLFLQGYTSEKITIITSYAAQVAVIESERDKHGEMDLTKVRVSTVDAYQGEENDIILLSLVRSNKQGYIGFLKTPNRACVALSRAKNGLYIVGNMACLTHDQRSIWCAINKPLVKHKSIGTHLTLRCKKHKKNIRVSSATDFNFQQVQAMGCPLDCDYDDDMVLQGKHTNNIITQEFFNQTLLSVDKSKFGQLSNDNENKENLLLSLGKKNDLDMFKDFHGRPINNSDSSISKPINHVSPLTKSKIASASPSYFVKDATCPQFPKEEPSRTRPALPTVKPASTTTTVGDLSRLLASRHIFSPDYGQSSSAAAPVQSSRSSPSSFPQTKRNDQNTTEITRPPQESEKDVVSWTRYFGGFQFEIRDTPAGNASSTSHSIAVEPPPVPSRLQGAIPKSSSTAYSFSYIKSPVAAAEIPSSRITQQRVIPQDVPLVNARVFSQDIPRVTPRVVPQDIPRVTPRVVPQDIPRVTPRVVPQDIPRVTPRVVPQDIPQVTPRVVPSNNVELGEDVLGIHRITEVWTTPEPTKKKKKCVIQ